MNKKMNNNVIKIVTILNDQQYHDGNSIGKKLKMTRSAVWKIIKKLQQYGIKIDSVKGKGYVLLEPLILLDINKIKKNLQQELFSISIFESIDSTNDYLKAIKQAQHTRTMQICLAEQQTQGRARLQRQWYSPFGRNIYFSCLYPLQKDVSELAGLSLVTSLAVLKTLKSYGIDDKLQVKWPNDIVYANKKLSGSLIDVHAETHGMSHVIIGIGINVNMLEADSRVSQAWTSMQKILNQYIDRNQLCTRLINYLLDYLQHFAVRGFSYFMGEWLQADCLANRRITLNNMNEQINGEVTGISEQGHLLLKLANGSVRAFSSGDASIVK